ncbi:V-type ATP synthase subunit E [Streptosporangium sp. NPDC051022]|uniref:V-type ATP synthase subunit E n=1 Tax=Streptosporangium sp. NPDC051022 TaxID=3155752 RepID=UPI00343C5227
MTTVHDPLAPLIDGMLRRARADAAAIGSAAEKEAAETVETARREAQALLAEARASGAAQARKRENAERARVRHQARGVELAARREVLEELRTRAVAAVRALRDDPLHPRLVERVSAMIRAAGGEDLVIREHPGGGVVAEGRGHRVDCTLDALAGRAVDALGGKVERLWAP